MSKRDSYIGARVSEQEKQDIIELAKGMDITVSDFIRHRIIQPIITLPEAIQNIKLYFDGKLKNVEHKIIELSKELNFVHKPNSDEYNPNEQTNNSIPNTNIAQLQHSIAADPEKREMRGVLIEFQKKVSKILKKSS